MEDFIAPPSAELPDYRQLDIPHLFNNKVSWWLTSSNLQDTSNNQNKSKFFSINFQADTVILEKEFLLAFNEYF